MSLRGDECCCTNFGDCFVKVGCVIGTSVGMVVVVGLGLGDRTVCQNEARVVCGEPDDEEEGGVLFVFVFVVAVVAVVCGDEGGE